MPFNIPSPSEVLKNAKDYKKVLLFFGIIILVIDILSVSYFRIMDRFELVTLDFRYSLKTIFPIKANPDIAIIEIGEDTLNALGKWPIPRDYHASLVDVLKQFGARAVMFDILFCEPTGWDSVFARSVKNAGNVYFPIAFALKEKNPPGILEASDIDAPLLEDLKNEAKGVGYINKITDIDGKVRRAPLFIRFQGKTYRSLALKIACDYMGINPDSVVTRGRNRVLIGNSAAPIDENGMVLLNFAGRWADVFKHYSYVDILAAYQDLSEGKKPRIDLRQFKGKVCFVGLTATGTQELGPIPIENAYPMLGIHANLFNMLTERSYLKRYDRFGNLVILIVLSLGLIFLLLRARPYVAFFISLGIILSLSMFCILLFAFRGIWIDMVCPDITLFGIYLSITITRYINEIKVREKMQKELAVAASIQKCFLPAEVPSLENLDVAVEMKTAKEVGGDLYDFIKLGDGKLGVMIGDVSGKGVPASLFMARIETLFKVYSKSKQVPSSVISNLNKEVASDERSGLFTTLTYAIFDLKNKRLVFSDAGHLPIVFVHNNKAEKLSSEDGMAVGIMAEVSFSDKAVGLAKGDVVVFYTDGVSEARDLKGNEFGLERLVDLVNRLRQLSATEIVGSVIEEVRRFQGRALQHDDMTIIVAKVV